MIIEEGKFLLYSHITPALKAGDYRFEVGQAMTAKKGTAEHRCGRRPDRAAADPRDRHRAALPAPPRPGAVHLPPAGTEGAYGSRLPQIVIKRRTLPWERGLQDPRRPRRPDRRGRDHPMARAGPHRRG